VFAYQTERVLDVRRAGFVVHLLSQFHVLVTHHTRPDYRVYADAPHHAIHGVPEVVPAADLHADGFRCRMQMPPASIAKTEQISLLVMDNPLLS
jgi:hypothetical protein